MRVLFLILNIKLVSKHLRVLESSSRLATRQNHSNKDPMVITITRHHLIHTIFVYVKVYHSVFANVMLSLTINTH